MSIAQKTQRPGWGCSLAVLVLLIGVIAGLALLIPQALALLANQTAAGPSPLVDHTSSAQVAAYRAAADEQLKSYGWVDQTANLARIPIGRAIALVAAQGLAVGAPAEVVQPATGAAQNSASAAAPTQVDFQRDVLPIFEQHCTECHGFEEPEEGLVLTGYRSVMQGSSNGPVIVPGDPDQSYLVEQVVKGRMPKRGKKLIPAEIAIITAWVKEGALEEAAAPAAGPAATLTTTATVASTAVTSTVAPTATATLPTLDPAQIDFQRDVLPIFEQHCTECHGFEEPEEGLVLTGYRSVMQGSSNGPVIVPGDPDQSYLVEQVVKGRMPKRGKKLTPAEIAIITAWVQGGALEQAASGSTGPAADLTANTTVTATATITAGADSTAKPTATTTVPVTPTATSEPAAALPTVDPAQVDFKSDVLPIFEQHCTECHGFEEPEEGLVLTGYRSVMQGSNNGPVIEPGDPEQSYLIEQVVKGKMPKRGKKLTPEEIAIITAWVQGGALEQAAATASTNVTATVTVTATQATVATPTATATAKATPTTKPPATATVKATPTKRSAAPTATATATVTATEAETPTASATISATTAPAAAVPPVDPAQVSFKTDVLPIFEQHCTECHGFEEPEEGLVLTGYRSVMQGSNNGPVIEPGDPEQSYLIEQVVKGKMPKRGKKLTPEEIAIITAWVQGGAPNN